MTPMDINAYAAYAFYLSLACTALDRIFDALRPLAEAWKTDGEWDNKALEAADALVSSVADFVSLFSLRLGKKA